MVIKHNSTIEKCRIRINGNNNRILLGCNVKLKGTTFWIEGNGNTIIIGDYTSMENGVQLIACEGRSIVIGNDCMFSHHIYVRTTDSHSIINKKGCRINDAKDIHIGNHVWVGMQSLILKGAKIPDDCIVGARSIVGVSEYSSNSILAGSPAKIIKTEVNWNRKLL